MDKLRVTCEDSVNNIGVSLDLHLKYNPDSVTRSPLYSLYGETISGVAILRAFGASSKFLRDMLRCVDTNICPYFWMWGGTRLEPFATPYLASLQSIDGCQFVLTCFRALFLA
jgi:hypothetical protein